MKECYVVILNYNSANDTCALYGQLKKYHPELFVYVVDNNSSLDDVEILKSSIPKEHLILSDKNFGYAKGNNIGIEKSIEDGANYVWILNPDIQIQEDTLKILMDTISQNSRLAAIGPRICYRNNRETIYSDGAVMDWDNYMSHHKNNGYNIKEVNDDIKTNVDYINGSVILLNVEAIKKGGYFFEDFFLYYEEAEWCNRLKKLGWELAINPKSVVYHKSSNKGKLYHYYMIRNRLIFAKMNNDNFSHVKKQIKESLIKEFTKFVFKGKRSPFYFSKIKGYWHGLQYKL